MKFQIVEEDFMGNGIFRGTELYGIRGDWYEDYEEHGGLFFSELFTSYREASLWLLEQGYEIEFDNWQFRYKGKQEITFVKQFEESVHLVYIEKMEVIK